MNDMCAALHTMCTQICQFSRTESDSSTFPGDTMAIAIIIFILCLTTIEASSSPTCTVDTSEIDRMVDSTKSSLESKGYSVVEGTFKVVPSNSYGANPGNPYVTYYHPGLIDSRYPIFTMKENSAVIFRSVDCAGFEICFSYVHCIHNKSTEPFVLF